MPGVRQGETVTFPAESGPLPAYLVRPDTEEPRPAVLEIHEIFGLTDHHRDVARRLAAEGYVALAPDLLATPELAPVLTPARIQRAMQVLAALPRRDPALAEEAIGKLPETERAELGPAVRTLLHGLPRDAMTRDLVAAVRFLRSLPFVRRDRVGSVGFCFGGNMSIRLACATDTAACVVFYGENPEPVDRVRDIRGPVLGLYGADDARINTGLPELVRAMAEHKKDFEMKVYPGAGHAFFNDTSPRYRKDAAEDAWERVLRFLRRALGP